MLKNKLTLLADTLRNGKVIPTVILVGGAPGYKIAGWLLLKAALLRFTGATVGLDDLVTLFLTNDKRDFQRYRNVQVLHLVVGDEYTQKIHQFLLDHLFAHRSETRFITIISSRSTSAGLAQRYGNLSVFSSPKTVQLSVPEELLDA